MTDRAALGWAVLFALPVGVGVVLAFAATTGRFSPLALGSGLVATIAVFVLVLGGASGPDP